MVGTLSAIGASILGPSLAAAAGTTGSAIAGGAALAGTASGLANTGVGIAQMARGGGSQQQPGQVPGPNGNPMEQNHMGGGMPQSPHVQMNPLGGLPGGGGWMA